MRPECLIPIQINANYYCLTASAKLKFFSLKVRTLIHAVISFILTLEKLSKVFVTKQFFFYLRQITW